jgi:hypothetical protein
VPDQKPTPTPTPTPVVAEKATIHLAIESDPPGATVTIGGEKKGVTPYQGDLAKGPDALEVKVTLADHKPASQTIHPDGDVTLDLVLEKVHHHDPKSGKTAKTKKSGDDDTHSSDDTKNPFDRLKKGKP